MSKLTILGVRFLTDAEAEARFGLSPTGRGWAFLLGLNEAGQKVTGVTDNVAYVEMIGEAGDLSPDEPWGVVLSAEAKPDGTFLLVEGHMLD